MMLRAFELDLELKMALVSFFALLREVVSIGKSKLIVFAHKYKALVEVKNSYVCLSVCLVDSA